MLQSSRQDGGIGRNTSLPRTTKRTITTNLKSINNQKCQKIKLCGTLTTKELKEQSTRTTRLVRQVDRENPQWDDGTCGHGWLNRKLRLRADCGLQQGLLWWEKLPVSHKGSLESGLEPRRQAALFPLWPLPHRQRRSTATQQKRLCCWGEYLRPRPLTTYQLCQDKEIGPKWNNRAKLQKES